MSYGLIGPMHGQFGFIPIAQSQGYSRSTWTVDQLLKSNGIIALIIGSLVFLTVYAYVDSFATLYRESISGPNTTPITQGLLRTDKSYIRVHNPMHLEGNTLPAKYKFLYAIILTLATVLITYLLLFVWQRFELN